MFKKILILIILASTAHAKSYRLAPGETLDEGIFPIKIFFERFHTTKTECAVPGFNCGAGYTPQPVTTPVIKKIWKDKTCEQSPQPQHCEVDFQIVATDSNTYIEIKMINPFDRCLMEQDKSNKNSCILRTTKGPLDGPTLNPANCKRIEDIEYRDNCFETLADKLQNPKICDEIKGPQGFQCIYLRAKMAKDPSICHQLKLGPRVRGEADRKAAISSCLNTALSN